MNRVPIYTIVIFFSHGGSLLGTWAFSSCAESGLLFVMVGRLLIVAAALSAEHRL